MKKDFTKDFNEIKEMANKIRTLNEAINFADEYDDEDEYQGNPEDMQGGNGADDTEMSSAEQAAETAGGEAGGVINQIRELTLKGMVSLCNNPESAEYQTLKKIFTFCDKAVLDKDEEQKA